MRGKEGAEMALALGPCATPIWQVKESSVRGVAVKCPLDSPSCPVAITSPVEAAILPHPPAVIELTGAQCRAVMSVGGSPRVPGPSGPDSAVTRAPLGRSRVRF
jgi:hypothetical protein